MDEVMSEKSQKAMAHINRRANQVTTDSRIEAWESNVRANRKFYHEGNATLRGLTAYIVAAGPSLSKNIQELKRVGNLGVIIAVDAALRPLLNAGIRPDYCMSIDSGGRCIVFTENLDTSGITLISMTSGAPNVIEQWQGPRYFVNGGGGSVGSSEKFFAMTRKIVVVNDLKPGDEIDITKDIEVKFPGVMASVNCGGNVTTAAWSFAYEILRACKIVFVGADYSWEDAGDFYADGNYSHLAKERKTIENVLSHPDINGKTVNTNLSLSSFKGFHDRCAIQFNGTHVNATEGGILGIGDSGKNDGTGRQLPGWEFLTLREAIDKYTPQKPAYQAPAKKADEYRILCLSSARSDGCESKPVIEKEAVAA